MDEEEIKILKDNTQAKRMVYILATRHTET